MNQASLALSQFNSIMKHNEDIYRGVARAVGLSDTAFWILYALRDTDASLTQSAISQFLHQPKQTVNSALKKLEEEGVLTLHAGRDQRKKHIGFTPAGLALAGRTVDRVMEVESHAMQVLSDGEQATMLALLGRFTAALGDDLSALKAQSSAERNPYENPTL